MKWLLFISSALFLGGALLIIWDVLATKNRTKAIQKINEPAKAIRYNIIVAFLLLLICLYAGFKLFVIGLEWRND